MRPVAAYQNIIDNSYDLKQLESEGYEFEIKENHLLVYNVPYLNRKKDVKLGTLVTELSVTGDMTYFPKDHTIRFIGEYPCDEYGNEIEHIRLESVTKKLSESITINHTFSSESCIGLNGYYRKVVHYVKILLEPAEWLYPGLCGRTYIIVENDEEETVFNYFDTNSSRAEIFTISTKLKPLKIGIIGLSGTGSYILDFVAKTPVSEIHLFDGGLFIQHNAFRSPGAPPRSVLNDFQPKVHYFKSIYENMHKNIIAHECNINDENVDLLAGLDFVFISIDTGQVKKNIINKLESMGIPFIDMNMEIQEVNEVLNGDLSVTANDMKKSESILNTQSISFEDTNATIYNRNIQTAELNALSASLAVIKWKKLFGIYFDNEHEMYSKYTINNNQIQNEGKRL